MKTIKYIASLLAGITLFSCDNFEDINTNPDAVTKVSPKLLATGAIVGLMKPSKGKDFIYNLMTANISAGRKHWKERSITTSDAKVSAATPR